MNTMNKLAEQQRNEIVSRSEVRRALKWILAGIGGACFACFISAPAFAQNYLTTTGTPSFSAPEPVEYGFTETANGSLHLEFPMGSFPQRANKTPYIVRLIYNSQIWTTGVGPSGGTAWSPTATGSVLGAGWKYMDAGGLPGSTLQEFDYGLNLCGTDLVWTDPSNTPHYFSLPSLYTYDSPPSGCSATGDAFATDSSGYHLYALSSTSSVRIYAPDGTLVYAWQLYDKNGNLILTEDPNGNYTTQVISQLGHVTTDIDTVGRQVLVVTNPCVNGNQLCFDVPNSQTSSSNTPLSRYTVTTANISVKTAFGQSGVTEYSGTITVVQSITLPDNTTFTFTYDCDSTLNSQVCSSYHGQNAFYGVMTSMTLPTGAQVSYRYASFSDVYSNKALWLGWKYSTASGSWTYTPQVLSTCSPGQPGCSQKVTVRKPSGDSTVTTFTVDNGAWPTLVQSYDAGGALLSTVTTTWDFTRGCVIHGCKGHGYIRKLSENSTMYIPGGSLTNKRAYTYQSTYQNGLISSVQEWAFYPGLSPNFPSTADRTTNFTYYSAPNNNINRPQTISVYDSGNNLISSTTITYDGNAPQAKNGVVNHDDTNFGGNTARGNATQILQWMNNNGPTYATTQLSYDTTGQVLQKTDPSNVITSYTYGDDKFFYETGPSSNSTYAPSVTTNAYPTVVTVGTTTYKTTYGYYFGSGKQAFSTDPNSATISSFYWDPFDRTTEVSGPIDWKVLNYTSSTQTDTYVSVNDTTPSQNCSSCRHNQITYDGLGRKINEQLVNNPGSAVNVDTVYDTNGRVQSVSHPYTNSSSRVWETFAYDGLDRKLQTTHPDGQSSLVAYGAMVNSLGGVTAQQSQSSTYGYGYPVISQDESGKQRQQWIDGFGRIIEVDEPSASGGTQAGSTVTMNGYERSVTLDPCKNNYGNGSCPYTIYDSGTVSLTVDGFTASASYGSTDTAQSVASGLAYALSVGDSPVTATANGAAITIKAKGAGASGDFSFSVSCATNDPTDFPGCSFWITPSSGSLTGGTGGISSSPVMTAYKYDAGNRLTQVVQSQQTRTFAYDGLGHVASIQNPELSNTPSQGQMPQQCPVSFTYDGGGNVLTRTTPAPNQQSCANSVTTTFAYNDPLHRVTSKTYSNGQGSVTYAYDQGANALGRLGKVTDPSGSEAYSYDLGGRVTQLQKTIGSGTYTIAYQPNQTGQLLLTKVTYPSGRVVQANVDAVGRLTGVQDLTANVRYTSGYAYNAAGQVTSFNYGNGVAATFGYSSDRSQMTSLSYAKGSTTLLSLQYGYKTGQANCSTGTIAANNGLIQCIQDVTDNGGPDSGRSVVYGFDGLNRLISAVTTGSTGPNSYAKWGYSWTYDPYGNRTTQTITAGSGFSNILSFGTLPGGTGACTNRPDGYSFDAAGNMLNDGVNALAFDAENRALSATNSGASGTYTYDDHGMRVTKVSGGTTTVYVFVASKDIAEYDNGAAPGSPSREYIYSGGRLVATLTGTTTTYHHADHLSVRVTTDANGNKVGEQGHYPYGEQWYAANTTTKFFFTSYERDSESGNDYAMARFYINRFGRFSCVDPVLGSPADPQSWNRYAYARNAPIMITDPSGKFFFIPLLIAFAAHFVENIAVDFMSNAIQGHPGISMGDLEGAALGSALSVAEGFIPMPKAKLMTQPGRFFAERTPIDFAERAANSLVENEALNGKARVDWANAAIGTGLDVLDNFITYKDQKANASACAARIISRVNQNFGTQAQQVGDPWYSSTGAPSETGTMNLNISIPVDQPGATGAGYYGGTFGPLHIADGAGGHGGLDSPNTLPYSSHSFTAHIDSGNPSHGNFVGAGWHFLRDMTGIGGYRPCP